MVRVERSIWEVEAASVQTLKSIDDLNLHKALLKRVQVMVTAIKDLTRYLINESDEASSPSDDNESLPVSMIKILKNESTITRTASLNKYENLDRHTKFMNLSNDINPTSISRHNNQKGQKSPVKVLTSISRIIIGEDRSLTVVDNNTASNESKTVSNSIQGATQRSKHKIGPKIMILHEYTRAPQSTC